MHPVIAYLTAAALFGTGVYGVLRRRNAILVLMAVELMLNAVNLIFVTADATVRSSLVGVQIEAWAYPSGRPHSGGVFALFVVVLAAAEVGVGLAIVLQYYRMRAAVAIDGILLADPPDAADHPADLDDDTDPVAGDPTLVHTPAGHPSAGDTAAGDTAAGDTAAGDTVAGDTAAGDTAAGDTAAEDTAAGYSAAGDSAVGDTNGTAQAGKGATG